MFELSRVRLFSVGPPGARYQDVCLDLRGVGAPVATAARQADLFAADDVEGTPRRPSPASVLFLENGGGKSVLLKLVFSVLLPGRRQVVGTTSTDVLAKFVLGEDVAHVACEWMHTATGALLVTGKVSEWPGHTASADANKLADAWYSFRPGEGFGLDDLPFTVEGRRVTMTAFKDRLHERHREDPASELAWETGHRDWTRHLVDVGLDPELFRYQRAMNAGEGEAAEAFAFPSDEAFVDFLLRAVLDPEEPQNLADLVAGYATKIAQRADLEAERDFVEGTLERLSPLEDAERAAGAAREAEAAAQRAARGLSAAIVARKAAEDERLAEADALGGEAADAERDAVAGERRLAEIVTELRRLVAVRELDEAVAHSAVAEREHAAAEHEAAAWQAVEPVLRHRLAAAEAVRLRRVVDAEAERARPALRARQAAAAALGAGLRVTIDEAQAAARESDGLRAAAESRAKAARAAEVERAREAAAHRATVDAAHTALGAIRDRTAAAVTAGLLGAADDPAATAAAAERDARDAAAALAALAGELSGLRRARREADGARARAHREADTARAAHERAEAAHTEACAVRDALAAEPRLAELLGVEEVAPGTDASALVERLGAALSSGEAERTAALSEQARDQRALRALGEGGLLPEPGEIEDVLAVLEGAGITAWSGWRYLTMLPAGERASVVERLPHLAGGVLLNDAGDAERAAEELAAAKLLPCAVVAVGSTAAVSGDAVAPGVELVVPPNPAMLDEDAAAATREELAAVTQERSGRLDELAAGLEADRALLARVRAWQERRPPVDELAAALDETRARLVSAQAAAVAADSAVATVDARAETGEADQPRREAAAAATRERAAALAALAEAVTRGPVEQERIRLAEEEASRARAQEATAREEGDRAREDAEDAARVRDRRLDVAERARSELAELPLDGDETLELAGEAPPLSVLRGAYEQARAAYAAAEVGADLSAQLELAEREARSALGPVDALDPAARAGAETLLRTPEAADQASRRGAADQARRTLARAASRLQDARTAVALAGNEVKRYPGTGRPVDPYGTPEGIEDGRERIARAETDRRAAESVLVAAHERRQAADRERAAVAASAEGFGHVVGSLDEATSDPEATPFAGTVDAAVAAWSGARAGLKDAAGERARVERVVRTAVDAVAQFAQEPRFGTLTSPVRRHIAGVARADMPGLAGEWAAALRPRLRSLTDDLASIGRHHSGIVTRLAGMVGEALRTLRLAQRLSELPEGLADWSGQQFLRIRFDDVEDAVLRHELGEVVDRTAEQQITGKGGAGRRDGMALLLAGVRAAMPKGVRVEMLKPDAVLRTERLRVSQIRDVFSGGQQLTAAIVLYCTMAALRAHQRGHGRRPHAGVLFLDNPIGRASAGYLLELQFGVARALGVQLVYTTGLFDAGALSGFPLVIRLRNDADLRAGRKYLSVDGRIAHALEGLDEPDGSARVSATRVFRRPAVDGQAGVEFAAGAVR
jgi:hypothetical protein